MLKTTKLFVPAALVMSVFAGFMLALGARPSPTPALIAVVDIPKTFDGLEKKAVKEKEWKDRVSEEQAKVTAMQIKLKNIEKELDILGDGPDKKAKLAERTRLYFSAQTETKVSEQMLLIEKGDLLRELYNDIDAAAEEYAKKNGYTMVLLNDQSAAVPEGLTEREFLELASRKKMLYADPTLDITAELITYMNNKYKATGAKPAGGAAAASGKQGG
jgi:Skp family chaperone for outer membrane proteins